MTVKCVFLVLAMFQFVFHCAIRCFFDFINFLSSLADSFCNLDIPIIDVELDGILDLAHISPFRNSLALINSPKVSGEDSEDECESTVLWCHWDPPQHTHTPSHIPWMVTKKRGNPQEAWGGGIFYAEHVFYLIILFLFALFHLQYCL